MEALAGNTFTCVKIPPQKPPLHAGSSPRLRIRKGPISEFVIGNFHVLEIDDVVKRELQP